MTKSRSRQPPRGPAQDRRGARECRSARQGDHARSGRLLSHRGRRAIGSRHSRAARARACQPGDARSSQRPRRHRVRGDGSFAAAPECTRRPRLPREGSRRDARAPFIVRRLRHQSPIRVTGPAPPSDIRPALAIASRVSRRSRIAVTHSSAFGDDGRRALWRTP
jgi:hypothetical protein